MNDVAVTLRDDVGHKAPSVARRLAASLAPQLRRGCLSLDTMRVVPDRAGTS